MKTGFIVAAISICFSLGLVQAETITLENQAGQEVTFDISVSDGQFQLIHNRQVHKASALELTDASQKKFERIRDSYSRRLKLTTRENKFARCVLFRTGKSDWFVKVNDRILAFQEARGLFDTPSANRLEATRHDMEYAGRGPQIPWKKVNEAIGMNLFSEEPLWESDCEEVAARLGWPEESKTKYSQSFRLYTSASDRYFNTNPPSCALYGEGGKVDRVSIVFANKGDSFYEKDIAANKRFAAGMKDVREAMEHDSETVHKLLTDLFGEPARQKFGEGESRNRVLRWDWRGNAFILTEVRDEFVALAIHTWELADEEGIASKIPDEVIRERILGCVEKRENRDVVINHIPMVDQGTKGYCVPASFERALRFMGVPADMYLLAVSGETDPGGGTRKSILDSVGRDIKRKGRGYSTSSGISFRYIKKSIDQGMPLIWNMYLMPEFSRLADERTRRRKADWTEYLRVLKTETAADLASDADFAHVNLIVGYNEETKEIAFSDSGGESYRERWVLFEEAEQVCAGATARIEP